MVLRTPFGHLFEEELTKQKLEIFLRRGEQMVDKDATMLSGSAL